MTLDRTSRHPYLRRDLPLAMAHRGDQRRHPPGNMWPAFESAVELGFRYLETDVQATRDGTLVLFHDERLDEATTGTGTVADHRWGELSAIRYRNGLQVSDQGLVPLEEVVQRWPDLRLNLDAKTESTVAPLVHLVVRHDALHRVCLASFDAARLARLRRQAGPEACSILSRAEVALLRVASFLPVRPPVRGDAAQVPPSYRHVPLVDRRMIAAAHGAGLDVHVWTIDDPGAMERLLDLGVDGLITNDPATLRQVLAARGQWPS